MIIPVNGKFAVIHNGKEIAIVTSYLFALTLLNLARG